MINLTAQKAFNKVARHLLTQNDVSFSTHDGACVYRGDEGRRCAIGALIPNKVYNNGYIDGDKIEGKSVTALIENYSLFPKDLSALLEVLQNMHDRVIWVGYSIGSGKLQTPKSLHLLWKADLARIAKQYGLSAAVLNKIVLPLDAVQ